MGSRVKFDIGVWGKFQGHRPLKPREASKIKDCGVDTWGSEVRSGVGSKQGFRQSLGVDFGGNFGVGLKSATRT